MSRSYCVLPSPYPVEVKGWRPPRRVSELASGVAFAAAVLVAPVPAFAGGADWSACLHAADPNIRAMECTEIIENTRERKILLRALNARGNALCATADRCREAVPDFTSVVKLAPDVAGYHGNLARALRAAMRYEEALQESDRAIGLAPKLAFVYVGKARTLVAAGRGGEALAVIQAAMAMVPVDAGLLEYQGKLLGDLRRYPESYAAFERALQMQPTRVSVYVRRADVEATDGRTMDAIRDLERYPVDGSEAIQVHAKLDVLLAIRAGEVVAASSTAAEPAATPPTATAKPPEPPSATASAEQKAAKVSCNLNAWQPLQRCIEEYHTENDPLPGGIPNPRRWNDELAAHGHTLAEQHPEVLWDRTAWIKLADQVARDDASERAELEEHRAADVEASHQDMPQPSSETTLAVADGEEVDKCNSPRVLDQLSSSAKEFKSFFDIKNIRQSSYDSGDNIRYCAADFIYDEKTDFFKLPPTIRMAKFGYAVICARAVTYQVEKTLDNPGAIYVTFRCQKY